MKTKKPKYSAAIKARALKLSEKIGPVKTAEKLGMSRALLWNWRKEAGEVKPCPKRAKGGKMYGLRNKRKAAPMKARKAGLRDDPAVMKTLLEVEGMLQEILKRLEKLS